LPFRITGDGIALPEIAGDYNFDKPKAGRPAAERFDTYSSVKEAQHCQALGIIFADRSRKHGYSDFRHAIRSDYGQVIGWTVGEKHVTGIVRCLKNKRVVTQEDDRKG